MEGRNRLMDIIRGVLIVLVVVGHSKTDILHDIIFLFHMPLFFILSGFFLQKNKLATKDCLKNKMAALLVPYGVYLLIDFLLIRQDYSIGSITRMIYGGRSLSGVYWYITCFLFTLFLFAFLLKHLSQNTVKRLILVGGVQR